MVAMATLSVPLGSATATVDRKQTIVSATNAAVNAFLIASSFQIQLFWVNTIYFIALSN
jgi:hypothetical protein